MLSCVWFVHPLSWEQWIGAVSLILNPFLKFFFIIKSPITNCIGYFDQVIVFGTLYAKTFLKNPPQKPSLPEPTGNGATSPVKQNPV